MVYWINHNEYAPKLASSSASFTFKNTKCLYFAFLKQKVCSGLPYKVIVLDKASCYKSADQAMTNTGEAGLNCRPATSYLSHWYIYAALKKLIISRNCGHTLNGYQLNFKHSVCLKMSEWLWNTPLAVPAGTQPEVQQASFELSSSPIRQTSFSLNKQQEIWLFLQALKRSCSKRKGRFSSPLSRS